MTPLVVVLVLLLLSGDAPRSGADDGLDLGGGKPAPPDGEADDESDEKCPPGAPLIYTGPLFDDAEYTRLQEVTEGLITPTERAAMLYVIGKADSDDGYPAPADGTCLLEDLQVYLAVPANWPNLGHRGWPAALALLAWNRAHLPLSEPRKLTTLTEAEKKAVAAMARYIKERQMGEGDEEAEQDPDDLVPTDKPTLDRYYLVRSGDTLLAMSGAATGYPGGSVSRREYAKKVTTHPRNATLAVKAKPGSFDEKYMGGFTLDLTTSYSCEDRQTRGGNCYPAVYFPPK